MNEDNERLVDAMQAADRVYRLTHRGGPRELSRGRLKNLLNAAVDEARAMRQEAQHDEERKAS